MRISRGSKCNSFSTPQPPTSTQKSPYGGRDENDDENKEGGGETKDGTGEDKYGGDSEAAAAAKSSARARAATLGDSSTCEAEVKREMNPSASFSFSSEFFPME